MEFIDSNDLDNSVDYERNTQRLHSTVIAKTRNFINEGIHRPSVSSDCTNYEIHSQSKIFDFPLTIYANGNSSSNKGYVSIIFRGFQLDIREFEFSCFVSVLDVHGNKRFLQSFSYSYYSPRLPPLGEEYWPTFGIDKYIKRTALLREQSELLPDDTLTLLVDIIEVRKLSREYMCYMDSKFVTSSFKTEDDGNSVRYYLLLDSIIGKFLHLESNYFRHMLTSSMKETESGCMNIPQEEYRVFLQMGSIIIGASKITVESVNDIFELLAVADKYCIPFVTETCWSLLKSYHDLENSVDILKLADEYFDGFDYLKQSMKELIERSDEESESMRSELELKEKGIDMVWSCEKTTKNLKSYLLFRKDKSLADIEKLEPVDETSTFDFYS